MINDTKISQQASSSELTYEALRAKSSIASSADGCIQPIYWCDTSSKRVSRSVCSPRVFSEVRTNEAIPYGEIGYRGTI